MKTIKVNDCNDCPFLDAWSECCDHPEGESINLIKELYHEIPIDCPLKNESIKIELTKQ